MDEVSRFYNVQDDPAGTHLALRWKGRVRYTVPREGAGQRACWKVFRPGALGIPLQAMTCLPRLLGSTNCTEGPQIALMRDAIGEDAGLSCCRAGAPGPWSKETILFLEKKTAKPLYLVKAGGNAAVNSLLQNEANWLRKLGEQPSLSDHVPELVAHHPGDDFCFIAQRALSGDFDFRLGKPQVGLLRKLHEFSSQTMRYEDSKLYRTLNSRVSGLAGRLTEEWSSRIEKAMQRIQESFAAAPIPFVAAHNDFTPWNIRTERGVAKVFDWEYADDEQLPLFDPLHFVLAPMALRSESVGKINRKMDETLQLCRQWFGQERCYKPETQALTYFVNLCTLYLWTVQGTYDSAPVLDTYARIIDSLRPL